MKIGVSLNKRWIGRRLFLGVRRKASTNEFHRTKAVAYK
jgi:hypothetical protein